MEEPSRISTPEPPSGVGLGSGHQALLERLVRRGSDNGGDTGAVLVENRGHQDSMEAALVSGDILKSFLCWTLPAAPSSSLGAVHKLFGGVVLFS